MDEIDGLVPVWGVKMSLENTTIKLVCWQFSVCKPSRFFSGRKYFFFSLVNLCFIEYMIRELEKRGTNKIASSSSKLGSILRFCYFFPRLNRMIVCYFYGPPLLLLARYSILPWFSTNHNAKKKEKKSKNCNQFSKFQVFFPFFFLSLNQVDNVFEVQNTSRSQRSCKEPNATTIVMFKGWLLKLWSISTA